MKTVECFDTIIGTICNRTALVRFYDNQMPPHSISNLCLFKHQTQDNEILQFSNVPLNLEPGLHHPCVYLIIRPQRHCC